jgi:hypothetical protein
MHLPLLFHIAKLSACQDPRDKIFAMLGLLPRKYRNNITMDYEMSLYELDIHVVEAFALVIDSALDMVQLSGVLHEIWMQEEEICWTKQQVIDPRQSIAPLIELQGYVDEPSRFQECQFFAQPVNNLCWHANSQGTLLSSSS